MNSFLKFATCAALLGMPAVSFAQNTVEKPVVFQIALEGGGSPYNISDNGKWVVGSAVNPGDSSLAGYPTLVNAETGEVIKLWNADDEYQDCGVRDVTDDGVVAGWHNGKAALWFPDERGWVVLPQPAGQYLSVMLYSITPDGKYAVGGSLTSGWITKPVAYRIDGDKFELVDIPESLMNVCMEIGDPDGRFHRVLPGGLVPVSTGLFDLNTGEIRPVGTRMANEEGYSPDGRWMLIGEYGEDDGEYSYGPYTLVDLKTGESRPVEDNSRSTSIYGVSVDNDGNLYGNSEHDLMFRTWHVHVGKYWYDFRNVLRQVYGVDWNAEYAKTSEGLAGTFWGMDNSGKVFVSADYTKSPVTTYIVRMPDSFGEICPTIDLLDNYYVTPMNGASFSRLSNVSVTFDRQISVLGNLDCVKVVDEAGNTVRNSINFSVASGNPNVVNIAFRNYTLADGKKYTIVIPAGAIGVKSDEGRTNSELRFSYVGRPNTPVKPLSISPADGNEVPRINLSSNPVQVNFDTNLSVCENPDNETRIALYMVDGDEQTRLCALNAEVNGSNVVIYPVNEQRLAQDKDYRVVINAGTFADLSGANPNEEIVVNYKGSYTPAPPSDNKVIFSDNFNAGLSPTKWMFFEGDGNTPNSEAASWDFTADGTPWYFVRDSNESTDWAACSHSMYIPAGQSDDWMVTQRLYIGDDTYRLKFKSQSYRKDKEDILKVIVWASDDVVTALTPAIVNSFRYQGNVVYEKRQDAGANEAIMAGEWTENEISLKDFAGKNIYVAFVNNNNNQSAIFLDDVEVSRDLDLSIALFTPEYLVGKDEMEVSGHMQNLSSNNIDELTLNLKAADGSVVDKMELKGLGLKPNGLYQFKFGKKLPIAASAETYYSVELVYGGRTTSVRQSVKNLAFQTTRRVVLEEYTGTTCGYCPQGHVVIERLAKDFGDRFIPIAIHAYDGGRFYSETARNYARFLGLAAAPTASIDRLYIASPLSSKYELIDSEGGRTWYDIVSERLGTYADADIDLTDVRINGDAGISVEASVKFGYDASNLNVNLLTVVMEDGRNASQTNNFVGSDAPIMAEWAEGGIYGSNPARFTYSDIMQGTDGATFNGNGGHIPSAVKADTEYKASITMPMPQSVSKPENTKVAVIMIDANTGRIINAALRKMNTVGVEEMMDEAAEVVETRWYNMQGMLLNECPEGIALKWERLSDGTVRTSRVLNRR